MAIPTKVKNYLDKAKIKYKPILHKTVYTAYDAAATMRAKLSEVAKVLHVIADKKRHIVVVLPASQMLDMAKLKKIIKARKIELATEKMMQKMFKVKPGAMPPFAGLYKNTEVFVDKAFSRAKRVIAGAGTFTDSLEMKTKDFLKAVGGRGGVIGKKRK